MAAAESRRTPKSSAVLAQLARVLGSRTFAQATALNHLLRHVVERTIQGRTDDLKEYALGVDVFHRGTDFDPRADTIVRVQARRLRAKLDDYYRTEGRTDPVIISLPRGRYVPEFRQAPAPTWCEPAVTSLHVLQQPFRHDALASDVIRGFSLPAPRTALIGRTHELAAVEALLQRAEVRLITLTGTGGSGKTRLAQEAAARAVAQYPGGVAFVSLASLTSTGAVISAIAQVLGLRQTDGRALIHALTHHVQRSVREPMLLVLDNFEHLVDAAPLLVTMLDASSPLKMLVTSRSVLHVYGEYDFPVPPLELPAPSEMSNVEVLRENAAVALFMARAAAADPAFALTAGNAEDVARICCRVDGLPLAIELAAAGVRTLTPSAILGRLHSRLDTLSTSNRDVPARQQTLRKTVDWSHSLLTPAEQQLFRRLSVFAGGCTAEGAEAVCNVRLDLQTDVTVGLSSLLDKSLLQRTPASDGEPRFAMIETVREYALELLAATEEASLMRKAHAAYCLVLAEEGNRLLTPAERDEWFARCDVEHDNYRTALDWLIGAGHAEWAQRMGVALHGFWARRDHLAEARAWLEAILDVGDAAERATRTWAKASSYAAGTASLQGDFDACEAFNRAALDVYRRLDDQKGTITMLMALGFNDRLCGDFAAARCWFEQCLEMCRRVDDPIATAAALANLGGVLIRQAEPERARALLQEALERFRALESWDHVAWALNHLGDAARERREYAEAVRWYDDGLETFRRLGDRWGEARSCADLGELACLAQDFAAARRWFETALGIFSALQHRRGVLSVLEGFARLAVAQGEAARALTLGGAVVTQRAALQAPARPHAETAFRQSLESAWRAHGAREAEQWWAAGTRLTLDEAEELALAPYVASSVATTPGN